MLGSQRMHTKPASEKHCINMQCPKHAAQLQSRHKENIYVISSPAAAACLPAWQETTNQPTSGKVAQGTSAATQQLQ
jgi:hypothetical protein